MNERESAHRPAGAGYLLTECLIYLSVVLVLLTVGYLATYRCMKNSVTLRRSAEDIAQALSIGEIWREDVRRADRVRWVNSDGVEMWFLEGAATTNAYALSDNRLSRWTDNGPWVTVLANVEKTSMQPDKRAHVEAWRWELELKTRTRFARVVPLFTFTAVPGTAEP